MVGMSQPGDATPSLHRWAGGEVAIRRLIDRFYDRVEHDDLLSPFFPGGVHEEHRAHVAAWWSEVLGGPARYTEQLGGYESMLAHHRGLAITPEQRFRFASLLSLAATTRTSQPTPSSAPRSWRTSSGAPGWRCTTPSPEPRSSSAPRCRAGAGARRPRTSPVDRRRLRGVIRFG